MHRFILTFASSIALVTAPVFGAETAESTTGGFAPQTTFTLRVKKVSSTRTKGLDVDKNVPIPSDLPKFRKGKKLDFVIGRDGQLKGPGFSIQFRKAKRSANVYLDASVKQGEAATVAKVGDEPVGAVLTFYKTGFSGFRPVTYEVVYVLE